MEKVVIRRGEGKWGYEYVVIHHDGTEEIQALDRKTPDECLYLPKNPMGRKFISLSKLEKNGGYLELQSKVGIEEYLDEEDRILYLSLIEKALENKRKMEEAQKNLSPLEKAQLEYKKAMETCLKLGIDPSTLGIKI